MRYALEEYDRRLQALQVDSQSLAQTMRRLSQELEQENFAAANWEAVDELQFYRTRFIDLRQELLGIDAEAETVDAQLPALQTRLTQLHQRTASQAAVRRALQVRGVRETEGQYQTQLTAYVDRLLSGTDEQLAAGELVVSALLCLVSAAEIPDAEWHAAQCTVATAISQELATAAARGRLRLESTLPESRVTESSLHDD